MRLTFRSSGVILSKKGKRTDLFMAKVVVGMSGGVDSAVTAYLLKEAGYEVTGLTIRTWEAAADEVSRCCEIDRAQETARILGIPYQTINCAQAFREHVTEPFVREYVRGRTPSPCIDCNRFVKWEWMLYRANVLGAEYVATGHYAAVRQLENGRYTVQKAVHAEKDQTYMLYRLSQEQLKRTLMPLGAYAKTEVREIAAKAGLPSASAPDSQEICFVTEGHYADYIEARAGAAVPREGRFVDEDGVCLGTHKGIIHYTVGQRRGLGLPLGFPAYVKEIRANTNEVVIAKEEALYHSALLCERVNFMSIDGLEPGTALRALVKIRYAHKGEMAELTSAENGCLLIRFDKPVKAPAPGQSAVFYDAENCVIGGGIISEIL